MNPMKSPCNLLDLERVLNEEQVKAVLESEGPCLVLAGAGSGKTRVLVYRTVQLLRKGVLPSEICLLTFTNRAGRQMVERVCSVLGLEPEGLIAGTFHHVGNLAIRTYRHRLGLPSNYLILDSEDSRSLVQQFVREAFPNRELSADIVRSIISFSINTSETIRSVVLNRFSKVAASISGIEWVAEEYRRKKDSLGVVDYDDLLDFWLKLLIDPEIGERISQRFKYVLVDEYQDTNRIQAQILYRLSKVHGNLFVVGDDAQSIYSFRGATVENILSFPKIYPNAKVFYLETNYRSTPDILHLANRIISHNRYQFPKSLRSIRPSGMRPIVVSCVNKRKESLFVCQRVSELLQSGIQGKEIGILFRSRHQAAELEIALSGLRIPYTIRGGLRFFEQAHIKDVVAFFRAAANPAEEVAWRRILKFGKGIGKVTEEKILASVAKQHDLEKLREEVEGLSLSSLAIRGWNNIVEILLLLQKNNDVASGVDIVLDAIYREYAERIFVDARSRLEDIEEIKSVALVFPTTEEFLNQVSLQEEFRGESSTTLSHIVLSTIHQAKGLEWKVLFIIGICTNHFPHEKSCGDPAELEEERRVFYVGATRAKDQLYLTHYLPEWPKFSFRKSRFIEELGREGIDFWNAE